MVGVNQDIPEQHVDNLHRLPNEILVEIIKLSPDFSSLWSIINVSPHLAALFRENAMDFTERVLLSSMPIQTQNLLVTVLQLRTCPLAPTNLSAVRGLRFAQGGVASLVGVPSSKVIRECVFLAHKIHILAHKCIDYYIQKSMGMNPFRLVDPKFRYGSMGPRIHASMQRPPGEPYQPRETGPPSWIEEQRVIKTLWMIQLFYELGTLREGGLLPWSEEEQAMLVLENLPHFFTTHEVVNREQVMTILEYFQVLCQQDGEMKRPFKLPRIREIQQFATTCSPEPIIGPKIEDLRKDIWKQGKFNLDHAPIGIQYVLGVIATDYKYSPLPDISFSPYRKFGFAFWDSKRMTDLGLWIPKGEAILGNRPTYFYRWRSILSKEEDDEVTLKLLR